MIVYIDVLIIINVYVTYFTIKASARLLHTGLSTGRTCAAAVFGGFSSLAAMLDTGILLSLLIKAALTVVMTLIAFGYGSPGKLMMRSFLCISSGMLICGAAVMIHEFIGTDAVFSANGYFYLDISAPVLLAATVVIYAVLCAVRRIFDSPCSDRRIKLTVTGRNGRTAVLSGISDSGNYLRDVVTGRPVIICRKEAAEEVMPDSVIAYLAGSTDNLAGIRLIPVKTAAGSTLAPAFLPECLIAETGRTKKRLDALIAPIEGAFGNEGFDALLSDKLLT